MTLCETLSAWRDGRSCRTVSVLMGLAPDTYSGYESGKCLIKTLRDWVRFHQAGCILPAELFPENPQLQRLIDVRLFGQPRLRPQHIEPRATRNEPRTGSCGREDTRCYNRHCYFNEQPCPLRVVPLRPSGHANGKPLPARR